MIINIKKGDAPKTSASIERAKVRYMNAKGWPEPWRSEAVNRAVSVGVNDPLYQKAMAALADFRTQLVETLTVNTFNAQLADYRKAAARLNRYPLAEGRAEVYEEQPTGEYDEEGNEITETVVVQTAIDPVEPTVEQPVYDDEGNQTGTETVTNPLIVQDEAERAEAQAVIDATPQEVRDYD